MKEYCGTIRWMMRNDAMHLDKFRNKYRIPTSRWKNWDYGSNAAYYVTICTQHRECYFGDIVLTPEKTIQFTEIGSIAHQYWIDIPKHFPFVELDAFVIMPNHAWQSRFHDHVIRDYNEYIFIEDYIKKNIDNWETDSFYTS